MLTPRSSRIDARTLRLLRVAGTSYLGRLSGVLVVLVTIPVVRAGLTPNLFGVWMMLSGLLAFFAFADLGVGNSVLNRITAAHARRDVAELRRVVIAGYLCTTALGAAVFAIWLCWVGLSSIPTSLVGDVKPENLAEVQLALHIFFALLALNIPASLVYRVQLGMQAGHWVGLLQFGAAVCTLLATFTARTFDGGLPQYVLASLGVQVFASLVSTLIWLRYMNRAYLPPAKVLKTAALDWSMISLLVRSGSFFLMLQLAVAFGFQSDSIVVIHQLGQAAYGDFAVVQRVYLTTSSVILAGLSGLWPAIGSALASGEVAWVRQTLLRSYTLVFVVSAPICLLIVLFMPLLLELWLGPHTLPPMALLIVLAVWTVMEALGNVSGAFLNAAQLLRAQVAAALMMSSAAFAGKWVLVDQVGAAGAVLATILAYSAISVPAQLYLLRRFFREAAVAHRDARQAASQQHTTAVKKA